MVRKLSFAVAGLGRMGARHALHVQQKTLRAELSAVCTIEPKEQAWARENLEPYGTTVYTSYDEMLAHPGLEAVLIATSTTVHADFTLRAIAAGKHVLCEKPLSTKLDEAKAVVEAAAKVAPKQKVMCGFSRRFDASYRACLAKVAAGDIGTPTILRSQTCDKHDPSGYFVGYSAASGGIFVDCSIHDIDLSLMYFGEDVVPKSVYAVGVCAVHPELLDTNDRDNAVGVVEYHGGRIAHFYASRMMAHGQNDCTEITGTRGGLRVNLNPMSNLVDIQEAGGIRREVPQDYFGRFQEAFVTEVNEFTAAVLDDTPLPLTLTSAYKALEIGAALQEALVTGKKIEFDASGKRL